MCLLCVRCKGLQRECSAPSLSALQRVRSTHLDSAPYPLDLFGAPVEQCPELLLHRLAMPLWPKVLQLQHPALVPACLSAPTSAACAADPVSIPSQRPISASDASRGLGVVPRLTAVAKDYP